MKSKTTNNIMPKVETELSSLIPQAIEDPDLFYRKIGQNLTPEEKEYIKSLISKDCNTCANGSCRVESFEKINFNEHGSDCLGWENNKIIGEYKVLKLNKKR